MNVVLGYADTGKAIVNHPKVDKIAFTGSTEVGKYIMSNCSINNIKKITLELGGKSPTIILDDAHFDLAISVSQIGTYF